MNKLILTHLGGLNIYQDTLGFMQDSYDRRILALASILGDNVIVSGVQELGPNVTSGWVIMNGELLPFTGGPVTAGWKIMKETTVDPESFADGAQQGVYEKNVARISNIEGTAYTSFFRLDTLKTVITVLNDLLDDFTTHTHAWSEITDKPTIPSITTGSFLVGNAPNADGNFLVNIPDQGTTNYRVLGTLVSQGANWNDDNDVIWMIREKTATSFRLLTKEVVDRGQNLRFEYVIIK